MTHKTPLALVAAVVVAALAGPATAQEQILSEIKSFGFDFCPRGWVALDGQTLQINQNQALFSLIGTTYGGDGRTTFGLPDMRGRASVSQGALSGSNSQYTIGQKDGTTSVTLTVPTMPSHDHALMGTAANATTTDATNNHFAATPGLNTYAPSGTNTTMNPGVIGNTGGSQPHENRMPFLATKWCIAVQGIFPSRS